MEISLFSQSRNDAHGMEASYYGLEKLFLEDHALFPTILKTITELPLFVLDYY